MKKLTLNQVCKIVDFLSECYEEDYVDNYRLRAINKTLKILGYVNEFHYNYENDAVVCDGGLERQESV